VRACLSALLSKPRISELRDDILRLEGERVELQACLDKLNGEDTATATATSGAGAVDISLSPEERAHLEHEWKTWHRQATLRQRICGDMWDRCSEVLPENTSLAELWVCLYLTSRDNITIPTPAYFY
jgi:26S proteasome regulatory subunit (ATPase 3-interacting protein)